MPLVMLLVGLSVGADGPPPKSVSAETEKAVGELQKQRDAAVAADQFPEAIRAAERMRELYARELGADHWRAVECKWEADLLRKLAALPAARRAEWDAADKRVERAGRLENEGRHAAAYADRLAVAELAAALFGPDHPTTAGAVLFAAGNLSEQRKYADAAPRHAAVVAAYRKAYGENHPTVAAALAIQAGNLSGQNRPAEAEAGYRTALAIFIRVYGEDTDVVAKVYGDLAGAVSSSGRYAEAEPLYRKALAVTRRVAGEDRQKMADRHTYLANNLCSQGRPADAEPLFRTALDHLRAAHGEEHKETAIGYDNLAACLSDQGRFADADPLVRQSLVILGKLGARDSIDAAFSYRRLGGILCGQGRAAEAQPFLRRAANIISLHYGADSTEAGLAYNDLAHCLSELLQDAEAESLYRKSLAIHRATHGPDHPETATVMMNLGVALGRLGRHAEEATLLREVLALRVKTFGDAHPDTATVRSNLAITISQLGAPADAVPLFRQVLSARRQALGEAHPDTAASYINLGTNLADIGRWDEAERVLTDGAAAYESSRLVVASGLGRAAYGRRSSPYRLLAVARARLGRPEPAWAALEADLARGLLDESAGPVALTPAEQARATAARAELARLRKRITDAVTAERAPADPAAVERDRTERAAREADLVALAAAGSRRAVADLAAVQAALPADTALVTWADGEVNQPEWGCVLRAAGPPAWEPLPGTGKDGAWTDADHAVARRFRRAAAGVDDPATAPALARQLYAQRLAPLEKHLTGVRRLLVVPVGTMAAVPVEPLTDRFQVSYVPSGTVLARSRAAAKSSAAGLLAVGDPAFPKPAPPPPAPPLPPGGLLVNMVLPGGLADAAGVKPGDVLLRYAGTDLDTLKRLTDTTTAQPPATPAEVVVWRDGQTRTVAVPPGKLGVGLTTDPAPKVLAARYETRRLQAARDRGETWAELPGAAAEIARLKGLFGDAATTLTRSAATRGRLDELQSAGRLRGFRYLHFATHGEGDFSRGFQTSLILTPGPGGGRLTAAEVLAGWKLDADLVTLSACDTGVGRFGGGDGLLGFAQAFLAAGARAVCLTLWKVDDAAAALLMGRLYQNLLGRRPGLTGPMGKAAALAEAKAWLRGLTTGEAAELAGGAARGAGAPARPAAAGPAEPADRPFAHPKFWAAFVLIGDPD